jgi:4-hydroxy 2-oxovalerate aldolase
MSINLLDCTIREGTHLTGGQFGQERLVNIIEKLSTSGIEIVEIGFLSEKGGGLATSYFDSVGSAEDLLDQCDTEGETEFALMVRPDRFDVTKLDTAPKENIAIRIAFYQSDLKLAVESAQHLQSTGFDIFLNPIATSTYSDNEISDLAKEANSLFPRGVNIVDTFGALSRQRAIAIYDKMNNIIKSGIVIGVHLHQNMNLSQAIAQDIIDQKPESRDLIIDGALYGMGRPPGNLHLELISSFLNSNKQGRYDQEPIYESIDREIKELKIDNDWGYSPEYYLSAKSNVHRSYAEKMKKNNIPLKKIDEFCQSISGGPNAVNYDESLIDEYYDEEL